jgi:hypothetical protein
MNISRLYVWSGALYLLGGLQMAHHFKLLAAAFAASSYRTHTLFAHCTAHFVAAPSTPPHTAQLFAGSAATLAQHRFAKRPRRLRAALPLRR